MITLKHLVKKMLSFAVATLNTAARRVLSKMHCFALIHCHEAAFELVHLSQLLVVCASRVDDSFCPWTR